LGRSGGGHQSLVSLVPGSVPWLWPFGPDTSNSPGVEALNSNQLGQDLSAGPRIGLTYRADSRYGAEASYFNILGLSATKTVGPTNPPQWLVMKAPGTFWQTQDYAYQTMAWRDASGLRSLEANARLDLFEGVTLLAGFRWLQLNDELQGTLTPADHGEPTWKYKIFPAFLSDATPVPNSPVVVNPPFWTTTTTNTLLGAQAGARAKIWELDDFALEGTIKAGVYHNQAGQTTLVSMAKQIYTARATTGVAAFASEGDLVARYRLSDNFALRLSYEALWLAGVALAPAQIQQMSTTRKTVTARGVNCGSSALFQGVGFGLEYSF
jgi:hypothetical protein